MQFITILTLIILLSPPSINAAKFVFELSASCEIDKFWCINQQITENDSIGDDVIGHNISCGKRRLGNILETVDDGDRVFDEEFELKSKIIHDCTTDGSSHELEFQLTSVEGKVSQSDQLTVETSDSKHHIKYKIDLIKDAGKNVTDEMNIKIFQYLKDEWTN